MSLQQFLEVEPDVQRAQAVFEFQETAFQIMNIGRGSLDVYSHHEVAAKARAAAREVAGLPMVGSMTLDVFYGFYPGERPTYQRSRTEQGTPFKANSFQGVFQRLVNIEVPTFRTGETVRTLCLQLSPLAKTADQAWADQYITRSNMDQFNHPLGIRALAGRSAWVPINCLREGLVHFPTDPSDAQIMRRIR